MYVIVVLYIYKPILTDQATKRLILEGPQCYLLEIGVIYSVIIISLLLQYTC